MQRVTRDVPLENGGDGHSTISDLGPWNWPKYLASQDLKHTSENGRVRSYYFSYWIENGEAHIQWLDKGGRSQDERMSIEIGEW
jgi:hypothetical protein